MILTKIQSTISCQNNGHSSSDSKNILFPTFNNKYFTFNVYLGKSRSYWQNWSHILYGGKHRILPKCKPCRLVLCSQMYGILLALIALWSNVLWVGFFSFSKYLLYECTRWCNTQEHKGHLFIPLIQPIEVFPKLLPPIGDLDLGNNMTHRSV